MLKIQSLELSGAIFKFANDEKAKIHPVAFFFLHYTKCHVKGMSVMHGCLVKPTR